MKFGSGYFDGGGWNVGARGLFHERKGGGGGLVKKKGVDRSGAAGKKIKRLGSVLLESGWAFLRDRV